MWISSTVTVKGHKRRFNLSYIIDTIDTYSSRRADGCRSSSVAVGPNRRDILTIIPPKISHESTGASSYFVTNATDNQKDSQGRASRAVSGRRGAKRSTSVKTKSCDAIMDIRIESRSLRDLVVLVPEIFQDSRGFFMETYREDKFRDLGLPCEFVQDNHSRSVKGVVRGLHFQWEPPMGKLMRVTYGNAFL